MKIIIKDIPEAGMDLHWETGEKREFAARLTEALGDGRRSQDKGKADFHLLRTGANVDCRGRLACDYHPTCSRCLKVFARHLDIPIHCTLAPLYESDRQLKQMQKDEVELTHEDLEFAYYEGDSFDLGEMIREQVILELPIQPLCREGCKGLCSQCGKDLNLGPCGCAPATTEAQWKPLGGFRLKKD